MPTYEYHCNGCGFEFEEFQSIAAEPLHICPRCGGSVRRLISGGGGIIFKGSGFYETDYKHKHFREARADRPKVPETKKELEKAEKKVTSGE